jgi:hypothetical protein
MASSMWPLRSHAGYDTQVMVQCSLGPIISGGACRQMWRGEGHPAPSCRLWSVFASMAYDEMTDGDRTLSPRLCRSSFPMSLRVRGEASPRSMPVPRSS